MCRSGTWMMTGNGAMHNGTTVVEDYGTALERLQVIKLQPMAQIKTYGHK